MNLFQTGIDAGAVFDPARVYRYRLWREWREGHGVCAWLMLNPSTADEHALDPTLRRCLDFSKRWGFKRMEVVNLFAYRETSPGALKYVGSDIVGPLNDDMIVGSALVAEIIVCGWGTHPIAAGRREQVVGLLESRGYSEKLRCLRLTKNTRQPEHPLYLPKALVHLPLNGVEQQWQAR